MDITITDISTQEIGLWMALLAVGGLSALTFWKPHAALFMVLMGISMMLGLNWYPVYRNETGLALALGLVVYSLVCATFAFRTIFWEPGEGE